MEISLSSVLRDTYLLRYGRVSFFHEYDAYTDSVRMDIFLVEISK